MNKEPLDLLELLKADTSKSGSYLNELAQEFPFGVLNLLQRMKAAKISTIGLAFSHRNVSNPVFQQFFYDSHVLRMKTHEDAMIVVKALKTEDLKKSIREACIFLNTPPKVVVEPVMQKPVEVKHEEVSSEVELTRFQLDEIRYNELPKQFREAAEGFTFSDHKATQGITLSNQEPKTTRLNTRLMY